MSMEPFFKNPARKRRLVAFGFRGASLNPKRRKTKKRKNPPTSVFFPAHSSTLFRVSKSGQWGHKRRKAKAVRRKRRASPAQATHVAKGAIMAKHRKSTRRAKSYRRKKSRKENPYVAHSRRRRNPRHHRRSNPLRLPKLGLPPMKEVAFLTVGAIAARMLVPKVLTMVPSLSANGYLRAASRVGISAVASLLAGKILKGNAKPFIYGVIASQFPEAVNDVATQAGFNLGMSDGENMLSLGTYYGNANRPALAAPELGIYTGMAAEDPEFVVG